MLQEVDDFHRRTLLVVIVDFCFFAGVNHAAVDALDIPSDIENVHADLAEGSAIVGESAVADGGAGNGGEPIVKKGKFLGESGKDGKFLRLEVIHDLLSTLSVFGLSEIALYEALHVGDAAIALLAAKDLKIGAGKVVIRVIVELVLIVGERLDIDGTSTQVRIGFVPREAVDARVGFFQRAQHVVEGAVFHH